MAWQAFLQGVCSDMRERQFQTETAGETRDDTAGDSDDGVARAVARVDGKTAEADACKKVEKKGLDCEASGKAPRICLDLHWKA